MLAMLELTGRSSEGRGATELKMSCIASSGKQLGKERRGAGETLRWDSKLVIYMRKPTNVRHTWLRGIMREDSSGLWNLKVRYVRMVGFTSSAMTCECSVHFRSLPPLMRSMAWLIRPSLSNASRFSLTALTLPGSGHYESVLDSTGDGTR
jgi:hypothetical protein